MLKMFHTFMLINVRRTKLTRLGVRIIREQKLEKKMF